MPNQGTLTHFATLADFNILPDQRFFFNVFNFQNQGKRLLITLFADWYIITALTVLLTADANPEAQVVFKK